MLEISLCGEVVVYEQASAVPELGPVIFVTAVKGEPFQSRIVAESHVFSCMDATHLHEFHSLAILDDHDLERAGNVALQKTHQLLASYLRRRSATLRGGPANVAYVTQLLSEPPFSRLRADGMFRSELSLILDWTQFKSIRSALVEGICR